MWNYCVREEQISSLLFRHPCVLIRLRTIPTTKNIRPRNTLTTTIGMGVVAFLSKGLIGGITKDIYTTMIRDAGVFTDVNLDNKK